MNKKKKLMIEIVLFIIVLISITLIYQELVKGNEEQSIKENTLKNREEQKVEIMEIKNAEHFEQEVINESETVLIDFYATWCMPCKVMSPIIEEIAKEHKEIKVVKIDIDRNEGLAIKYNIMSIPTMLIMKNGEVTKTMVGIIEKQDIEKEF